MIIITELYKGFSIACLYILGSKSFLGRSDAILNQFLYFCCLYGLMRYHRKAFNAHINRLSWLTFLSIFLFLCICKYFGGRSITLSILKLTFNMQNLICKYLFEFTKFFLLSLFFLTYEQLPLTDHLYYAKHCADELITTGIASFNSHHLIKQVQLFAPSYPLPVETTEA